MDAAQNSTSPRPVSRGLKPVIGFIGIDSLYLVVEYPHEDLFKRWSAPLSDFSDPKLHDGIAFDGLVLRRGGLGYKLSVWDGDARLYLTDRVNDNLVETPSEGHGMGVMLQLGPQWLRQFGEHQGLIAPNIMKRNIEGQLMLYGLGAPDEYPVRINRMDLTIDLVGLDLQALSLDEWRDCWVGYARPKGMHFCSRTGDIEGFTVGTSQGSVRFKIYDKVAEARKLAHYGFWRSVWGLGGPEEADDAEEIPVARFEWSVRCYHARFLNLRYLQDLTFDRFLALLNYVSLRWGRLCQPQGDEDHKADWPLAPVWLLLRDLVDEWSLHYDQLAAREYVFDPDIKAEYLRFVTGALAGLQVRVGYEKGKDGPVSMAQALSYLHGEGHTMDEIGQRAVRKWEVFSRLARRSGG